MTRSDLLELLESLREVPHETECVEFKEARDSFHFDKLGKYFSGLSNEANLKRRECGWLIFGVRDDHSVCGSQYRRDRTSLDRLKQEVANHTTGHLTFDEIYVVDHPKGRVIMFKIPAAAQHVPTAWKGHWYGRNGESLSPLNLDEFDRIRTGASTLNAVDEFKHILMDYSNWRYDGIDGAVYLSDPDYTIKILDPGPGYGAGNYWWGRLFHEKPGVRSYSLRCKREEVSSVLVVQYRDECLKVPFPTVGNVVNPYDRQPGDPEIDCFCDVFFYNQESIKYSLLCHIRATETGSAPIRPQTPISSQLKPPIIRLPFLLLKNRGELESLLDIVRERMPEFDAECASGITSDEADNERKRMLAERRFSEWVLKVWMSLK